MKKTAKKSTLKRTINPMPANIRALLVKNGLLELYKARPAYQQNDYLAWIGQAKLDATKPARQPPRGCSHQNGLAAASPHLTWPPRSHEPIV